MSALDPAKISFRGLNIHLLQSKETTFESQQETETFIETIIRTYTEKKTKEGKTEHAYTPVTVAWDPKDYNQYRLKLYFSKRTTESGISQWVTASSGASEGEYQGHSVNFVFFLYRDVNYQKKKKADEKAKAVWEVSHLQLMMDGTLSKPNRTSNFLLKLHVG